MWNKFKNWMRKHKKELFSYILLVIGCYMLIYSLRQFKAEEIQEVTYNEFLEYLDNGDVDTVYYNSVEEYMTFTLLNQDTRDMDIKERAEYQYSNKDKRVTKYPGGDTFREQVLLKGANVQRIVSTDATSVFSIIISLALPAVLIIVLFRAMEQQNKGLNAKTLVQTSNTKFSDIIGHEEILTDIKFITELIKDPSKGDTIGAKVPKGLLLQGGPGTGKTLIAKAMAGEAGVPFLYQNASSFIEMFVGVGAKRVRDLFRIARKNAPCIIFIDEIDAIGCTRGNARGTSEDEQTINALLQEMDGFNSRDGVFIIAATNRADELDPALVRSGRFDRQIIVNPPDNWRVRQELFNHYLAGFTCDKSIDVENLSKQTSGFTGADIAMICNEASIIAVMEEKSCIDNDCIEKAIDKKIFKGNRSTRKAHERDRLVTAYHESGHAIMSCLLGEGVARAGIQSTVSGVGGAVFNQDKDTLLQTDEDLRKRILICYAGRASEEIKFGNITTGASNDITQATEILSMYVERFGFDKEYGLLDIGVLSKNRVIDGTDTAKRLGQMSLKLYDECKQLLSKNYDKVEQLAQKLLDCDSVSGEEIEQMFGFSAIKIEKV